MADTGIGMSEEVRAHIFDKYYQGNPNGSGRGLGLGLSIVQRIVELCGGQIQVDSVEDQGSTFTVRLPRAGVAPGGTRLRKRKNGDRSWTCPRRLSKKSKDFSDSLQKCRPP